MLCGGCGTHPVLGEGGHSPFAVGGCGTHPVLWGKVAPTLCCGGVALTLYCGGGVPILWCGGGWHPPCAVSGCHPPRAVGEMAPTLCCEWVRHPPRAVEEMAPTLCCWWVALTLCCGWVWHSPCIVERPENDTPKPFTSTLEIIDLSILFLSSIPLQNVYIFNIPDLHCTHRSFIFLCTIILIFYLTLVSV